MNISKSKQLYDEARALFPGGVNSPVRAFNAVGGEPLFIERGLGAEIFDADGNQYIDYVLSWGPLILGHAHPEVVKAVVEAAARGTSFGAPNSLELDLARLIQASMAGLEMLRFVSSGTEATMSAIRLARAFTGRTQIVKFEGCYHGHSDGLLVKAGSGVGTLGLPDSPGVPSGTAASTLVCPYNNLGEAARLFEMESNTIAAVIVEPVAGNMGVVPPEPGFLAGLRYLTRDHGSLLIFDEVMTGFRVHPGGAQALFGVQPDLTTLGKVIGGGLPVGAYGGRRKIMEMIAPSGPVYQAGTLSGNPLTMAAGIATLQQLRKPGVWDGIARSAARLADGLASTAAEVGLDLAVQRIGTMFTPFFTTGPVRDWSGAKHADTRLYARFFRGMLDAGIYLPPSQFEAAFLSCVHKDADIDLTIRTARQVFQSII